MPRIGNFGFRSYQQSLLYNFTQKNHCSPLLLRCYTNTRGGGLKEGKYSLLSGSRNNDNFINELSFNVPWILDSLWCEDKNLINNHVFFSMIKTFDNISIWTKFYYAGQLITVWRLSIFVQKILWNWQKWYIIITIFNNNNDSLYFHRDRF